MEKLTRVGLVCVLGLLLCLLSGTSGAFAQSVNQSNPAVAVWSNHPGLAHFWQSDRGPGACAAGLCHRNSGTTRCAHAVRMVKIWYTRHVMETFKILRSYKTVVVLHTDQGVRHVIKEVKAWHIRHMMRTIRALRSSRQIVQVCHA